MNKEFEYISYRSRRNKIITDNQFNQSLCKFSLQNHIKYILNTNQLLNLEIGFGSGEFIFYRAQRDKDNIYIGSEVYNPGIAQLLSKIEKNNVDNIYIFNDDARDLLNKIPNKLFNNIYILFPDPWPKKKHFKRRLININFLKFIATKFSSNLFIITDHLNYAENILYDVLQSNCLTIKKMKISNTSFFRTKYESKALKNSNTIYSFALTHNTDNHAL